VTFVLLWTTLIVAIFYPNILVLFSVLGGFCCGIIVLVLPSNEYSGFLKVKTENYPNSSRQAMAWKGGSILLFLFGVTGAIVSVAGLE
jgi:amino acid permease